MGVAQDFSSLSVSTLGSPPFTITWEYTDPTAIRLW